MKVTADLHLHSKYSRAVSQQMVLPEMAKWARRKGIDLLGTGDFTHPLWFRELKAGLEEAGEGIYKLKSPAEGEARQRRQSEKLKVEEKESLFLLTTEISSIYSQGGRLRRIHNLIFASSLEAVEKINQALLQRGANLMSDGRPIIGLPARDLAELVLTVDQNCLVIPAHAWTPWFSLYGSESGFDSINECFGNMAKYIYAVETGLSSNPEMNWRIAELDSRQIVSFSDAHSGPKLGREATVFAFSENGISNISYEDLKKAIKRETGRLKIDHTIEFYPEEGKYHYTGHRNCKVRQSPEDTQKLGTTCPVCGRGLTVGVIHRVEQLAAQLTQISPLRPFDSAQVFAGQANLKSQIDEFGVKWIENADGKRPPYVMLVPLLEIIAESFGSLPSSQKVINEYNNLTDRLGPELKVLLETPVADIIKIAGDKIADGVKRVREGQIVVSPGYDGEYGKVKIWSEDKPEETKEEKKDQLSFF